MCFSIFFIMFFVQKYKFDSLVIINFLSNKDPSKKGMHYRYPAACTKLDLQNYSNLCHTKFTKKHRTLGLQAQGFKK